MLITWRIRLRLFSKPLIDRSEEHTSELQSQSNLVCRLLLDKKNDLCGEVGEYNEAARGYLHLDSISRLPAVHQKSDRVILLLQRRNIRPHHQALMLIREAQP